MIRHYVTITTVSLIVLGAIGYGFYAAGTPGESRNREFDNTRVSNISGLKSEIESYYRENGKLPSRLSDLSTLSYSYAKTKDPETSKEYEFRATGDTTYKLCATFSTVSDEQRDPYSYYNREFKHPKGYYCFNLSISRTLIDSQIKNNYNVTLVSPASRANVDSPVTLTVKTTGTSDKKVKITFQKYEALVWKDLGETDFADSGTEQSIKVNVVESSFYWRARACDEDGICGNWSITRLVNINSTS